MPLTFIHAADFHLGAGLRRFGRARKMLEQSQFQALEKTMRVAADEKAAFVLICGDLFDCRKPSPGIVRKTGEILSSFSGIPVYILPGTHDFLSDDSILSKPGDWAGANVFILDDSALSPYPVPGAECHLYFKPNRANRSTTSPIAGLKRIEKEGFHVGLAHGSLRIGGLDVDNDFPIDPEDIEKSGLDYLALGHWHKSRLEKFGRTVTAYSGIGQPLSWSDPPDGAIFVVRLKDTAEAEVSSNPVSVVHFREIKATVYHPLEVARLLENSADSNTIVKLSLDYSDKLKEAQEIDGIIEDASSRYLLVQSDNQNSGEETIPLKTPDKVNQQFIEAFKAELARMQNADSPERSELYRKAAELGIAIITGEDR